MKTKVVTVGNSVDEQNSYQQAVDMLKEGEVISFPTETVYGLGAIATNEEAVRKIFTAKGRPSDNPLIVHIGSEEEVERFAEDVTEEARRLMKTYWPGPLTLIFKNSPGTLAPSVTPGMQTVGLRMPDHPVALRLLRMLGEPVAAPSANQSGKPSPTEAEHVFIDLQDRIPLILDGGKTGVGVESTVIDMTTSPPAILRPGGVTKEMIEEIIGPVQGNPIHVETDETPRSPGVKYTHYAPEAPLFVIEPDLDKINKVLDALHEEGKLVAVIGPNEMKTPAANWYFAIGSKHDNEAMASNLYRALRQCDMTKADMILAVETDLNGVGAAFMNRLSKAADGKHL